MNVTGSVMSLASAVNALRLIGLTGPERQPSKIDPGQHTVQHEDVAAAAAAVVLAGGDPLEDADVQRLILAERLAATGLLDAVRAAEDRAYLEQWREAAPDLRRQVIEKFDAAVEKMKASAERLPNLDMSAATLHLANLEPADAALAVGAIQAHSEVETIRSQWFHLLALDSGMLHPSEHMAPLMWSDPSAEQLDEFHDRANVARFNTAATPDRQMHTRTSWNALLQGMSLSLAADADMFAERVERVNNERAEREARQRERGRERGGVFLD